MKQNIDETIDVPEGVTVTIDHGNVTVKGPKGESARRMVAHGVDITAAGQKINFKSKKASKREKKMLNTFKSHIVNLIRGSQEPYVYKLKICSGHFPMTVTLSGKKFSIKNFLGEKVPRQCNLPEGADVKVTGQDIVVTSPNIEKAGQAAAALEMLTFKPNKDMRIFQDGIYITEKPSKKK